MQIVEASKRVYDHYRKVARPEQNGGVKALNHIRMILMEGLWTEEHLKKAIDNYVKENRRETGSSERRYLMGALKFFSHFSGDSRLFELYCPGMFVDLVEEKPAKPAYQKPEILPQERAADPEKVNSALDRILRKR